MREKAFGRGGKGEGFREVERKSLRERQEGEGFRKERKGYRMSRQEDAGAFGDFLKRYMRSHKWGILAFFLFVGVFLLSFFLYHLPLKAVIYPALLCGLLGILLGGRRLALDWKKQARLEELRALPAFLAERFPEADGWQEDEYQRILAAWQEQMRSQKDEMDRKYGEMLDYYTLWAHQIKTPIASMRLNLQNEDSPLSRTLSQEVLRIEQYVEMALLYLKLNGDGTDYVLREHSLEELVRQAVKKFAGQFILKKLKLELHPLPGKAVTDEKWMVFVLEQVLSNALKYTQSGAITIWQEEPATICIRDTGIGIAASDLPRIFEKGYTGFNGRSDKRASGIGLYLCRRICGELGHDIKVASKPDEGTTVRICLAQEKFTGE